jgi:hypothetical protein
MAALGLACLAACGSAGTQAAGGPSDSAMQAFRSCLSENGVTLPERGANGPDGGSPPSGAPQAPQSGQAPPGVDSAKWEAAQKACAQYAPARPSGAPSASS